MKGRAAGVTFQESNSISVPQQPHHPSGHEDSSHKHGEAVEAVADLLGGGAALGDAKNHGSENGEQQSGVEVRKFQGHGFFPIAIW